MALMCTKKNCILTILDKWIFSSAVTVHQQLVVGFHWHGRVNRYNLRGVEYQEQIKNKAGPEGVLSSVLHSSYICGLIHASSTRRGSL